MCAEFIAIGYQLVYPSVTQLRSRDHPNLSLDSNDQILAEFNKSWTERIANCGKSGTSGIGEGIGLIIALRCRTL